MSESQCVTNKVKEILNNNPHFKERCTSQEPSSSNTQDLTKNILNRSQNHTQRCKKDENKEKSLGDRQSLNIKYEAPTLQNLKGSSKCKLPSSVVFHFKLYIPPRLNTFSDSQERNDSFQFEQNERHNTNKKESGCKLTNCQSKDWKDMESYKDNVVLHLKIALEALEKGGIDTTTINQHDMPQKNAERIVSEGDGFQKNETAKETHGRLVHNEEVSSNKQINCKLLNINPCCKGCYSITSTAPSQLNCPKLQVNSKFLADHKKSQRLDTKHPQVDDSYVNEKHEIRGSILNENVSCLNKHYDVHLRQMTKTEPGDGRKNKKRTVYTKLSPRSTYFPSTWRTSTPHSCTTASKCSLENMTNKNTDSTHNGDTSSICPEEFYSSQSYAQNFENKKLCDNNVVNRDPGDATGTNMRCDVSYVEQKSTQLGTEFDTKKFVTCKNQNIENPKKIPIKTFQECPNHRANARKDLTNTKTNKEEMRNDVKFQACGWRRNGSISSLDKIGVIGAEITNLVREL